MLSFILFVGITPQWLLTLIGFLQSLQLHGWRWTRGWRSMTSPDISVVAERWVHMSFNLHYFKFLLLLCSRDSRWVLLCSCLHRRKVQSGENFGGRELCGGPGVCGEIHWKRVRSQNHQQREMQRKGEDVCKCEYGLRCSIFSDEKGFNSTSPLRSTWYRVK